MKTLLLSLICLQLGLSVSSAQIIVRETKSSGLGPSNLSRERDAFYLEDVTSKPMKLKVKQDAIVYNNLAAERRLGVIPAGTVVSVMAINEKAIRVRGRAEHDDVSGWIGKGFLQEIDPKVMENLQKMLARQKLVEELISKHEVAIGMTVAEVERVLGAPSKRSSRLDKAGRTEVYEYIAYKLVPQQLAQRDFRTGQVYYTTVTTKVETGRKTISFENGVASSIEETQERGPGIRNIPLPIEIDMLAQ